MSIDVAPLAPSAAAPSGVGTAVPASADRVPAGGGEALELVNRAQRGDREAFVRLYESYLDSVHSYIQFKVRDPHLAEDLTADVFLRAWRSIDRYRWQGVDFGAWLIVIARNRIADHFKSARVRREQTVDEVREVPSTSSREDPERAALSSELGDFLQQAMLFLSDDHQEVLFLRFTCDLSITETSAAMQRTEAAVKALQYRALRALAKLVKSALEDDESSRSAPSTRTRPRRRRTPTRTHVTAPALGGLDLAPLPDQTVLEPCLS